MVCNHCGIREASIMAISRESRTDRPRLNLCMKCWEEKWVASNYESQPLPTTTKRIIPAKPMMHGYSQAQLKTVSLRS